MPKRIAPASPAVGNAIAVASATGEPVKRIQLLPMGVIKSKRDGRQWRVRDAAHAQQIVDATMATADPAEIPIDYDHQLQFATGEGKGGTAVASGWMRNFTVEADGIYADVEWTEAAQAKLKAREYRYISPVFSHSTATGDVTRILHAGLTNYPAITELAAVASADSSGDSMDLTKLAACFGLPAAATIDEIIAAATAQRTALAAAAGLKAEATTEEIATAVAAAKAGAVDPTKFAPILRFPQASNARLKALEDQQATSAASAAVDGAVAAGKVTPANRDWAMSYASKDLAGFNTFVGNAPVVSAATAETRTGAKPAETEADLTPEQKAVCAATGTSEADFLKTLKEEVANGRA